MKSTTLAATALAILTAAALPLDSALAGNRHDDVKAHTLKIKHDRRDDRGHNFRHDRRHDHHAGGYRDGHHKRHKHGHHKGHKHHYYGGFYSPWRHRADHWVYSPYPLWNGLYIGGTLFLD